MGQTSHNINAVVGRLRILVVMIVPDLECPIDLSRVNAVHSQSWLKYAAVEMSSCLSLPPHTKTV